MCALFYNFNSNSEKFGCSISSPAFGVVGFLFYSIFIYLFIFLSFFFYYSYVHTRLGSFLPPAPTPSLTTHSAPSLSPPPQYPAETILPLFLILL
jgi:hypothetical protein